MRNRQVITLAIVGLSVPGLVAFYVKDHQLPSDEALSRRFYAHRDDFEKLVIMTDEDSRLSRIAPDFTWLDDDVSWPRKNVGISEERWNDYRLLFRKVGALEGLNKYAKPTLVRFPIMSAGSVPSGVEKGIAYSQVPPSRVLTSLDNTPPAKYWTGPDHNFVLVYKPIANCWYIYYRAW